MAEGEEEVFGVPVKTEIIGDTKLITIEGADLDKLKDRLGLKKAHRGIRCVAPPIGCDRAIEPEEFDQWDTDSVKEYAISGLCKVCQDKFFVDSEDPCTCDSPCCTADVGVGTIDCGGQHCPVHGENAYLTGEDGPEPPNDDLIPEELVH